MRKKRRKGEPTTARTKPYDEKTGRFEAKGVIQDDAEMDEHNLTVVSTSRLYAKDVDNSEKIGSIVSGAREMIADAAERALDPGKKIRFADTKLVIRTVDRYLQSCARIGTVPSKSGLAVAFGCDRRAFEKYMHAHPNDATTEYLRVVFEAFADINIQAGQSGSCHPIFAMFVLKALYQLRENEQIAPPADNPLGEITDTETLMKKYEELTVD